MIRLNVPGLPFKSPSHKVPVVALIRDAEYACTINRLPMVVQSDLSQIQHYSAHGWAQAWLWLGGLLISFRQYSRSGLWWLKMVGPWRR